MRFAQSLILSLMLVLPGLLIAGEREIPDSFKTLEELRSFVDERKGYGIPQAVDFDLAGLRLYVAINSPGSGSPAARSYAYFLSRGTGTWKLIDTYWFDRGGVPSYVYVDNNENELIFVSYEGKVIRRLKLKDYDFK